MQEIRTKNEIEMMKEAGKIIAACHRELRTLIKPGITTLEIDEFAEKFIRSNGALPEQKGYMGYPYATCASVNDGVCHCYPDMNPLKDGDIVKIDTVVNLKGWLADSAWCYAVGNVSPEAQRLMTVTKECLYLGIEKALPGNRIGDVSNVIQTHAESAGYSVVRDFMGHGIGKVMHDDLAVPHFGHAGRGPRIVEGMVFTIEPMINTGKYRIRIASDGWEVSTLDGSLSAQYEHTIAITENGPVILTEQD